MEGTQKKAIGGNTKKGYWREHKNKNCNIFEIMKRSNK